ncbi:unnamed protein product [Phytophthora lilii]|uniref:RxLR effector protein n=1 Tax=Phytophthora lilii TaxID=2077276 RepID=A0A9W6TC19_9STRA|nr:unnamed protein product [Phytophthora lilii]
MRVFSLLAAIVLASSCAAPALASISDKTKLPNVNSDIEIFFQTVDDQQVKRSLRSYDDEEERAGGMDKLDDAFSKFSLKHPALLTGWSTSELTKVDDIISKLDDVVEKYSKG